MNKLKGYFDGFIKYKYLIKLRIRHEIKAKYNNSFLGIAWSLLNPLLMMIVLTIIFSTIFDRTIENFPLYMISGRLLFRYFSEGTTGALKSIVGGSALIKKVYFPKYVLVISKITSSFIILLISMIDLVLVMIFTGAPFTIYLLYAPLYLILLYIFVLGCSLLLSTLNTFFRDIEHLYGVLTMVLMYLSAIFYPYEIISPEYQIMVRANPIFQYIHGFRHAVYYGAHPPIDNIIYCVAAAFIALIVGTIVFKKNQDKFILYI